MPPIIPNTIPVHLPGAIITSTEAGPLGLVTGALIVIAVVVVQGRKRISA